jgi:hypothetical protein
LAGTYKPFASDLPAGSVRRRATAPAPALGLRAGISGNQATCGAAGSGGSADQGAGVYFATDGIVCLDLFTSLNITANMASTSSSDVFGLFTIC